MPVSAGSETQASFQPYIFQICFFKGVKQREGLVAICFTLRNEKITCLHRYTLNHDDEIAEREVLLLPHFLHLKPYTLFQYIQCSSLIEAQCPL